MTDELKPKLPACMRTGMCCTRIELLHSPRVLREGYENWKNNTPDTVKYGQIWLIYPMLAGKCIGKMRRPQNGLLKYVYGPCKNLAPIAGQWTCTIHDNRPDMCTGFPRYDDHVKVTMGAGVSDNPSQYKGCGYNSDPNVGDELKDFDARLQPLSPEEM